MAGKRGLFIVLEGCDRAGKTTQTSLLKEYFLKKDLLAELTKFPERTTALGKMIDGYLQGSQELSDQAIHLLFSANRWEVMDSLKSKIQSGVNLVVDRYAYSGVAFTAAKGLDIDWCKNCDVGLIKPDIVFFLDTHPELMARRADFGSERYEKLDFQIKVREKFLHLKDPLWRLIDASRSIEEIHEEIVSHINNALNDRIGSEITLDLWKN